LPYTQMKIAQIPLPVVSASGVRLKLADGRQLIDGIASWWTACHGYSHPHIVAGVEEQLRRMPHVMFGGLAHEGAYRLAGRLARLLPGDLKRVFFSESGSVSVEVAMKMAVQFWLNQGERRTKFISFRNAYHGDTFAAMSVCDPEEGMHKMFRGVLAEQIVAELPVNTEAVQALDKVMKERRREVAGVIAEPLIQGAGGMKFHDAEVVSRLRELCNRHGLLLILDEIFTGFGRTGSMFACEQAGETPDIICLSKALTGGTAPLAATVATERVFSAFLSEDPDAALQHGPTFMAHALGCAAANASLDLFESEPRMEQARQMEGQMREELKTCAKLPGVRDVRAKGAVGVVQMDRPVNAAGLRKRFSEHGCWIKPFGDIVYLTPPLVIPSDDLSKLTGTIYDTLRAD